MVSGIDRLKSRFNVKQGAAYNLCRRMGTRFLQILPIQSELLGPPKKLCMSTRKWIGDKRVQGWGEGAGYEVVYPEERGGRIGPGNHGDPLPWPFDAYYGGARFCDEEAFVARIPRGRVLGEGAIITPDDQLLGDVSRELIVGGDQRKHSAFSRLRLPRVHSVPWPVAVLAVPSGSCYWHWMYDLLPRIHLLRRSQKGLDGVEKLVTSRLLHSFQFETLDALGIPRAQILEAGAEHFHLKSPELLVPSVIRETPPRWACDFLRHELKPKVVQDAASHRRRLYVSRSDTRTRRVVNEAELLDRLRHFGFVSVTLSGMTVKEQATLFASAETVVAPHGSGLANLAYCEPLTRVIEIFSPTYINPCYWTLSHHLGLEYAFFLGAGKVPPEPPPGADVDAWFFSFVNTDKTYGQNTFVDVDALCAILKRML